jgi:crotonobetainyl-CoA:carnitine CoA-transferase CaiB-like acyl-CoA transferase
VRSAGNRVQGFSAAFLNNNRNKRSIAIDLKSEGGKEVLFRLVKEADVFVQNFRPGVAERIGVGEKAVRAFAPEIIYVSISGFGENGPYATRPAYDPVIQALSGLASIQGGADDERPRLVRTILPDKLTAFTAAQAITAALFAKVKTGQGQHVRLSMLDTLVSFLWASDMGAHTFVEGPAGPERPASKIDLIYDTADGYVSVAVNTDREWEALPRALDQPDWLDDPRFSTPVLRSLNIDARLELIQEVLLKRTTEEWMSRFELERVPCAPVLTREEMLEHPQLKANETIVEYDHPSAGRVRQARSPAQFSETPSEVRFGAPLLAEHTDEILKEAGFDADSISVLRASGVIGN